MIRKLLLAYLVLVGCFAWGFGAFRYTFFPAPQVQQVLQLLRGSDQAPPQPETGSETPALAPVTLGLDRMLAGDSAGAGGAAQTVEVPGALARLSGDAGGLVTDGYLALSGAFGFADQVSGVALLDASGTPLHTWQLDEPQVRASALSDAESAAVYQPPSQRRPGGFLVLPDGSLVQADGYRGVGLFAQDACGRALWQRPGRFLPVVSAGLAPDVAWTVRDDALVEIDLASGEDRRVITINDIHLANPDIAIFTPRRSLRVSKWYHDPVHTADVEVLGEDMAGAFPQFRPGDLLASFRTLNTVAVIDPDTHVIKWWRGGMSQRQYDADFEASGLITVYDNNRRQRPGGDGQLAFPGERYSRILAIDPVTMSTRVLFDGAEHDFYNPYFGEQQSIGESRLLTSPAQGRIMSVDAAGGVAAEIRLLDDQGRALRVGSLRHFPADYFTVDWGALDCD